MLTANGNSYSYDDENRIVWVSLILGGTATYSYDADGRRIRKVAGTATEEYVYDSAGHQFGTMQPNGTMIRMELYAGARHLATYDSATNATYFIHGDWQGTERLRTNSAGASYETCSNLPFGDSQQCSGGTDVSPMHFTGKPRDPETNLDYFGARYYNSGMARWMSPDWAAIPATIPYAQFGDPQSLNLYGYVTDNPVSRQDGDGHLMTIYQLYSGSVDVSPMGNGPLSKIADDSMNDLIAKLQNTTKQPAQPPSTAPPQSGQTAQQHISARDKAYLDKYYGPVAAKAKEYGVDPALVLGLGGESGFADSSIKNNMYNSTGDAFGMTGGSTTNPATATSPQDDVNQLFANWGGQMRGAGSDTMKFLHGLEQEDANGNQLTGPPDKNGNRSNLGHIFNSKQLPPTGYIRDATRWINQMKREIPIYLSQ
jgi:RHS repeat-associated protein